MSDKACVSCGEQGRSLRAVDSVCWDCIDLCSPLLDGDADDWDDDDEDEAEWLGKPPCQGLRIMMGLEPAAAPSAAPGVEE